MVRKIRLGLTLWGKHAKRFDAYLAQNNSEKYTPEVFDCIDGAILELNRQD